MKLSDIKGERSLDIMADAMELAEVAADDERLKALVGELKGLERADMWRAFCKHMPPILRDPAYKDRVISILAAASGVTAEEYAKDGPVLLDLFELVTSDSEALGFLLRQAAPTE